MLTYWRNKMSKGKLKITEGDATEPQTTYENEIVVIPHCCNNKGAWGAGFVLALNKKWSEPEKMYKAFIAGEPPYPYRDLHFPILGKVCYAKINNHLVIANMIGQDGTKSPTNPKPVKYWALADAMRAVVGYIEMIKEQTSNRVVIHAPKFGSLRANGNWDFILELIREIWLENGIDVVIYEFKE